MLAVPTVAFYALSRRSMSISGVLGRVAHYKASLADDRVREAMADEEAMRQALEAATLDEFGSVSSRPERLAAAAAEPEALRETDLEAPPAPPPPLIHQGVFLVGVALGALLIGLVCGGFHPSFALHSTMSFASQSPTVAWASLSIGGILVGFGTRVAGGCTSGHGLSGCARRATPSFVATAMFMAAAVAAANLIGVFQ